jgi:hypothetical protein
LIATLTKPDVYGRRRGGLLPRRADHVDLL